MASILHIVVCAGIAPDPLQTLEPVTGPAGLGLKNEMVLPAVLDPWAASALYEAANLAAKNPGSKLWLVSLGPKAKLQQVMMTVAQKVAFELVPIDGPIGGFTDAHATAAALAEAINAIPGLDRDQLLLFGGWESATRGAGVTLQLIGEHPRHHRPVSRASTRLSFATTAPLKCWSALKAANTRSQSAPVRQRCSAGPPAICLSRATIRRSGWPTCAVSCLHCKKPGQRLSPPMVCTTSQ